MAKVNGGKREGAGTKKKTIDWKTVDNFLMAGCKGTEVAAHLGIHPDTLYQRCKEEQQTDFSDYLQSKRESGDALLRAAQFKKAIQEGDNTMLVWLGKQRLEQSDKKDLNHKNNGEAFESTPIIFSSGQSNPK